MRAAIAQGLHGTDGPQPRRHNSKARRRWRQRLRAALLLAQLTSGAWAAGTAVCSAQNFGSSQPGNTAAAPANAPQIPATISNQRRFSLPFSDPRREDIAGIQLLVSSDRGASWKAYDRQPPNAGQFVFQAPQDGEYWFSSRLIDRQNRVTPAGAPRAERRVVIDTRQPVLDLTVQVGAAGEILTTWNANDPHLEPGSLKLEYRPEQGGPWEPVTLPGPKPGTERGRLAGELTWWAKTQVQEITVRAEIADAGGNRAVVHRRVVLPKVAARQALQQQHLASNPERPHPYSEIGRPSVGATPWNASPAAGAEFNAQQQLAGGAAATGPAATFAADRSTPASGGTGQGELPAPRPSGPGPDPGARTEGRLPGGGGYQPASSRPLPPVQSGVRQPLRGLEELPGQPPAVPDTSSPPDASSGTASNQPPSRAGVPAQPAVTGRSQLYGAAATRNASESSERNTSRPVTEPGSGSSSSSDSQPDTAGGVGPSGHLPDTQTESNAGSETRPTLNPQNLPPGERPHMSASRRFNLDYDIDAIDRRDVAAVELWATLDGGRTWAKWGSDPDRQSPFDVQVDEDGYYGFRVVIVARNGLASTVPQAGDLADLWVGVDSTKPEGEITSVTYGENEKVGYLLIQWQTRDAAPAERPIGLAFAATKEGPWTTMAAGLPDTGLYEWRADPDLPREIYLRLDVKDRAGNERQSVLEHPIRVEGLRPKAKIHAIRPIGG